MQEQDDPWRGVKDTINELNKIGQDPEAFMDNVRFEIIENMKRDLNRTDIMLDDAKCEILKDWFGMECTPNYRGEEYYYEDSWMNLASCSHTDNGIVDSSGDTCKWYDDYKEACGFYDTKEFRAAELCCACGGGAAVYHEWTGKTIDEYNYGNNVVAKSEFAQ